MKLKFSRENGLTKTMLVTQDTEIVFDYIQFIKALYDEKAIEQVEFSEEFTTEETTSLEALINEISQIVINTLQKDGSGFMNA